MNTPIEVQLVVNGESRSATVSAAQDPRRLLARGPPLTGTHVGCEHGVCGACTVLVDGEPVRSCLMFAVQARGREVRTIEGLAADGAMNPLQEALWESHSFQCGFCTPGFVMQITALLAENPEPDEEQIRSALSGNICRCTGYQSIVKGVLRASGHETPAAHH